MKHTSVLALASFFATAFGTSCGVAMAATSANALANGISVRNIGAIQHTIMNHTIGTFEGTMSAALGTRGKLVDNVTPANRPTPRARGDSAKMYGRMPEYGTPAMYGEYGDDGTVLRGRSGGDDIATIRPTINNVWMNWQHVADDASFNDFATVDSDYDLVTIGLAGGDAQFGNGISDWGLFAGYVGGDQKNDLIDINENGGYVGVYSGYTIGGLNLSVVANGGALFNTVAATRTMRGHDYANAWVGAAMNVTYNIELDPTFTLQPGVYGGYTWVQSANYTMGDGTYIENQNMNLFEIAPGARAIKNLGDGWFGFIGGKYVFHFAHGGDANVMGARLAELDFDNYSEYGIGIEKSIDRFNMSINLGRRDGGRTGWTWGTSLKYIF